MEIDEAVYLFDKNKTLIESISPDEITVNDQEIELNGLITHEIEGVYQNIVEDAHFFGVVDIDEDNNFLMYKNDTKKTSDGFFSLSGTYVLFDDLNGRGGVIKDRRPQNESVTRVLPSILEGTGWQVGQVRTTNTGTSNYYYASKLEAFWDFLGKWNVEFKPRMTFSQGKITGKYIDIYDRLSGDYGKWYEYGDKLLTVAKEESSTNIFTAFIGRGKGEEVGDGYGRRIGFEDVKWSKANGDPVDKPLGQDYVEIPEATALYGYEDGTPRYTVVEFSDIEDEEELLRATYNHAVQESRPKVHFKSNVIEDGVAEPGETVAIIRDDLNIRYKTRIFKLKRNFKNKKVKAIEFGEHLVRTQAQRNKAVERVIRDNEKVQMDWLVSLRNQIIDSYYNDDGYNYDLQAGNEYDLPGGYYSFDRPIDQNPSKAIYMGAGRLLIANSKTPDGHWEWRTAATGDGIVADVVNSGVLRTITLEGGQNPENNYWNLSTGDFRVGGATEYLTWEPSNGRLGLYWKGSDTSIEFANGAIVSSAKDNSETYLQNGILGARNPGGASLGHIGYKKDASGSPMFNIQTSLGSHFTVHSNLGDGQEKKMMQITSGSDETLFYTQYVRLLGERLNIGWDHYLSGTTGRLLITGKESLSLRANESTVFAVSNNGTDNFASMHANLSMEGNTIINQSDLRLKDNIEDVDFSGIEETEKIMIKSFNYKEDHPRTEQFPKGKQFGPIAQYSDFLAGTTGGHNDDHYLSIDLNKQINLNTLTNQELIKRVKALEKKVGEMVDDGATGESAIE